jgi:small subunit ribosomal protein S17
MAHDEANQCKVGDIVAISECRPISRNKAWRVVEVVQEQAGN